MGREATARLRARPEWRSLSRVEGGILAIAVLGLVLNVLSFVDPPAGTSVVGHGTGLVVGVVAGIGERYVAVSDA
jgi:membrane associated rhomboid family serine protease